MHQGRSEGSKNSWFLAYRFAGEFEMDDGISTTRQVHWTRAKTRRQEQKKYPGPTCHRILAQHSRSSTQHRSLSNTWSRISSSWNHLITGIIFTGATHFKYSSYSYKDASDICIKSIWKIKVFISPYMYI